VRTPKAKGENTGYGPTTALEIYDLLRQEFKILDDCPMTVEDTILPPQWKKLERLTLKVFPTSGSKEGTFIVYTSFLANQLLKWVHHFFQRISQPLPRKVYC